MFFNDLNIDHDGIRLDADRFKRDTIAGHIYVNLYNINDGIYR